MISCGVRIPSGNERLVKLIKSHVVEFAVDDITEISWNDLLWNHLAIESKRKNLTLALAASHSQRTPDHSFDDIVIGKGRGLIMLF
jgi:hypothetical protein